MRLLPSSASATSAKTRGTAQAASRRARDAERARDSPRSAVLVANRATSMPIAVVEYTGSPFGSDDVDLEDEVRARSGCHQCRRASVAEPEQRALARRRGDLQRPKQEVEQIDGMRADRIERAGVEGGRCVNVAERAVIRSAGAPPGQPTSKRL